MDINALFPSDYLKAADFPAPRVLTIRTIGVEPIGDEKQNKPILHFAEETRGLVLNKTNGAMIAHTYGPETDTWLGKPIELHVEPVQFQGRVVDAIRVRVPQQALAPQPTAVPVQPSAQPAAESFHNDTVDF